MMSPQIIKENATFQDLENIPEGEYAELINGTLYQFDRPGKAHVRVASTLTTLLKGPFDLGIQGPGNWHILAEPGWRPDVLQDEKAFSVAPDLVGWRKENYSETDDVAYYRTVPDWICEILSPSTALFDRKEKRLAYQQAGIPWYWIVDPIHHTIEVYALEDGRYGMLSIYGAKPLDLIPPFESHELNLNMLWGRSSD